jgi:prepilin-type N-terminal cleavage/methylation domain-containing protein
MRRDARAESGLTLLELLVVLAIMGVLALLAVEAFRIGGRAWERGEQRAEEQQRLRVLYATLARDLASLQPATMTVQARTLLAFQGKTDRLAFFSAPEGEGPAPFNAMVRGVAYFVEPGKGLLLQESYPLVEGVVSFEPKEARLKVLDPRVESVRFRYYVLDKEEEEKEEGQRVPKWVDEWEPSEAQPARAVRTAPDGIPLAVEITVALASSGERAAITRPQAVTLYIPIRVGRRL